jgi:hypothetical protein
MSLFPEKEPPQKPSYLTHYGGWDAPIVLTPCVYT